MVIFQFAICNSLPEATRRLSLPPSQVKMKSRRANDMGMDLKMAKRPGDEAIRDFQWILDGDFHTSMLLLEE